MSRRQRNIQPDGSKIDPGNMGNPGGDLNMNNLGQFLNNVDLNQLMGQFSQMMGGPGTQGGPQGGAGGNQQGGFQQSGFQQGGFQPPKQAAPKDPRMQLMQALKPFLSKRRAGMLDNIGQLYGIFNIVKGMKRR